MDLAAEELAKYNGKDGQPAYVAVDGNIYDISESSMWQDGEHLVCDEDAIAGKDLTETIKDAPHTKGNLDPFPIIGILVD
jgi:predicted heme/steroid binding protein